MSLIADNLEIWAKNECIFMEHGHVLGQCVLRQSVTVCNKGSLSYVNIAKPIQEESKNQWYNQLTTFVYAYKTV